jgi:hypothetical protein
MQCCGVVYSTDDPETHWCIETYKMKKPLKKAVRGEKVHLEIVYTLFCKKGGCSKLEIFRIGQKNNKTILLETEKLKGRHTVQKFLERTGEMRIRQSQCSPLKSVNYSRTIPWVYGKTVDSETQSARYLNESGTRNIFKNNKWEKDLIKAKVNSYFI